MLMLVREFGLEDHVAFIGNEQSQNSSGKNKWASEDRIIDLFLNPKT